MAGRLGGSLQAAQRRFQVNVVDTAERALDHVQPLSAALASVCVAEPVAALLHGDDTMKLPSADVV